MNNSMTQTDRVGMIIKAGYSSAMTELQFFEQVIKEWWGSPIRKAQIVGARYYLGQHDILEREIMAIGDDGQLKRVDNLPNNRIVDNQYAKMVDQKVNYLLGKALTLDTDDKRYKEVLGAVFNKRFQRTLQNLAEDSFNGGVSWLHIYYDETGALKFKRFEPFEVCPLWADTEHTQLDCLIRLYEVDVYEGVSLTRKTRCEIYKPDVIERYQYDGGRLIPDVETGSAHYIEDEAGVQSFSWGRIPVIAFKRDDKELPLINKVKSLQDAINLLVSDYVNNMTDSPQTSVLVLHNYDGEDLGSFRRNLAKYRAIKVSTVDHVEGGVDALRIEVNGENYKLILQMLKDALISNAMGYDAKDDRTTGTPNQLNIKSMYSDIDLDANGMETEWQASLEDLLYFLDLHFRSTGVGDFRGQRADFVFHRDIMINESELMKMLYDGGLEMSNRTLLSRVPFVSDPDEEEKRLREQKEKAMDAYQNAFPPQHPAEGVTDEKQ